MNVLSSPSVKKQHLQNWLHAIKITPHKNVTEYHKGKIDLPALYTTNSTSKRPNFIYSPGSNNDS